MTIRGTAFLMYHELSLPSRELCHPEPGYTRYVVSASDFRRQMERLADQGWRGQNVSQSLCSADGRTVCITFDDGCETDLLYAAPILNQLGFGATFYLTVGYLGKPGYLTYAQVRTLAARSFEIGCHSVTHPYLTDIDDSRLREETAGAKDRLEQIAGLPVEHFSCPGGRWNRRVVDAIKEAAFRSMATSRSGLNSPATDPFCLRRVAVFRGTDSEALLRTCRGKGLMSMQLKEISRQAAKNILGNANYDHLRRLLLKPNR